MRTYHWLTSILFGAVIVVTAAMAAVRATPYAVPDGTDVIEGGLTRSFEGHYDRVFPVKTFGTNLWAAIQYTLFGEGRSGVVVGEGGWLYTQEEFRDHADAEVQIDTHLDLIERAQSELAARGTELVVLLLPSKARLYAEYLGEKQPAVLHRDLYTRLQIEMALRGVEPVDLLAPLARCKAEGPVFLRTDTHWTPQGAACAAEAIAIATGVDGQQRFQTEVETPRTHRGDLLQFLPLKPYFTALLPKPDLLVPRVTDAVDANDLLGDAPAPETVLIGTSYSADTRWNFDGALRDALDADVLNLAEPGKGPFAPMRAFLELPLAQASPRRVIWEIPERYLPAAEPREDPARLQLASHP